MWGRAPRPSERSAASQSKPGAPFLASFCEKACPERSRRVGILKPGQDLKSGSGIDGHSPVPPWRRAAPEAHNTRMPPDKPVRRLKTYTGAQGYVYQYSFVGKRAALPDDPAAPATEFVFDVTSDRRLTYA